MTEGTVVLVALGSNLSFDGHLPADIVSRAMEAVVALGRDAARSRLWHSPAWPPGGPDYINAAVSVRLDLGPEDALAAVHAIEARWGRERAARWGARTLDLDLLAWGDAVRPDAATQAAWRELPFERQGQETPHGLILPHPRMQDRGFVLAPLAEVAPCWKHPLMGRSVQEMLAALLPEAMIGIEPLSVA
jgi:2-amino-4-hydroxy-6-hydroxymethyldihydropteridine diphosphokinase